MIKQGEWDDIMSQWSLAFGQKWINDQKATLKTKKGFKPSLHIVIFITLFYILNAKNMVDKMIFLLTAEKNLVSLWIFL